MDIRDALAREEHQWITVHQNPAKKPVWPPQTLGLNGYSAVLPRGVRVLVSRPLVELLREVHEAGRPFTSHNVYETLSPAEAQAVRMRSPEIVYPQSCLNPPDPPAPEPEPKKKGK